MSDEPVSNLAEQLRQVAASVPTGRMSDLADELETIGTQLAHLSGGADDECTALAAHLASSATEAFRLMVGARKALHDLSDHHDGGGSGGPAHPPAARVEPAPTPGHTGGPQGADGSPYPADAQDPHLLPSAQGGGRTTGNASINGRPIGQLTSGGGRVDPYVRRAAQRLRQCKQEQWNADHVELQLVGRMADVRAMTGEVTINNVPCGAGKDWIGCHDVLERVLPSGATVTVKGTQRDGAEAFRHEYHGKGPSW